MTRKSPLSREECSNLGVEYTEELYLCKKDYNKVKNAKRKEPKAVQPTVEAPSTKRDSKILQIRTECKRKVTELTDDNAQLQAQIKQLRKDHKQTARDLNIARYGKRKTTQWTATTPATTKKRMRPDQQETALRSK